MELQEKLQQRSDAKCELCGATENLQVYEVPASPAEGEEGAILVCSTCLEQIEDPEKVEPNHWRCLNDSMWVQFQQFR